MAWSSPYFTSKEMACQCGCGQDKMDEDFMAVLTGLREEYGKPMYITSAYRCPNHPIEAKKSKPGAHTTGKAVDVAVSGMDAHELLRIASVYCAPRIGIQQKGSGRFIHIDICTEQDGFPSPTIWSY